MSDFNIKIVPKLSKDFNVEFPILNNATYKSLVNYSSDLNKPIQRWYRYKEGYSVDLMGQILDYYKVDKNDIILDPFAGSGSTMLEAKKRGSFSIGYEVNPFSHFLCRAKIQNYSKKDKSDFIKLQQEIVSNHDSYKILAIPKLSIIDKLFEKEVLDYLLKVKDIINKINLSKKATDLAFLGWLAILEEASNYRKAGNGLKRRNGVNYQPQTITSVKKLLTERLEEINQDLDYAIELSSRAKKEPEVYLKSCLGMANDIAQNSIKGVIFSPPYANCFDYTEIYKVELWLGDFVKEYSQLKRLRKQAITSHLNGFISPYDIKDNRIAELTMLVQALSEIKLWDKRIPHMVYGYFSDMFKNLEEIYQILEKDGFCAIIVSNSAYGGLIVPTDLFLAKYAQKLGFRVRKIDVARFIITSSQQYDQTKDFQKYLRESIIYLEKI